MENSTSNTMSLAEKAKTVSEIIRITRMPHGFDKDKWVLLSDAQQETEKLQTRLESLQLAYDGATDLLQGQDWYHKIQKSERELGALKQNLRELLQSFPQMPTNCNDDQCEGYVLSLALWKKELGGLVKP
jgi:hypothetical protein